MTVPEFLSAWGTWPLQSASVVTGTYSVWTDAPVPAAADLWMQFLVFCTCQASWTAPELQEWEDINSTLKPQTLNRLFFFFFFKSMRIWSISTWGDLILQLDSKIIQISAKLKQISCYVAINYTFAPSHKHQGRPHMNISTEELFATAFWTNLLKRAETKKAVSGEQIACRLWVSHSSATFPLSIICPF